MLISLFLSIYAALFHYHAFVFDPSVGFETRSTALSNQRLALDNLIERAADEEHIKSISKREITDDNMQQKDELPVDHKDINNSEAKPKMPVGACQQYFVLGTMIPYKIILPLSKLIFKVPSFNSLFNVRMMERLCAIDSIIDSEISVNGLNATNLKYLPFSFNLPYYTMCLNMDVPSNSCSSLNSNYINMFKSLILACQSDESSFQCQLPIAKQLSNMIFQKSNGPIDVNQPFYFAVVLPILQSNDGYSNLYFYSSLLHKIQEDYKDDELKLAGAQFGVKDGLFAQEIRSDVQLGVILGIEFFPFLNLLAMILVVAVGADDAFLFMYQYRKHKADVCKKWSPVLLNCDANNTKEENSDKEEA
ncbi:unnamed protein product, partial [Acanthocheilonema viteae]